MTPLKRRGQNKRKGVKTFRNQSSRTKAANLAPPPQRGGYRW